MLQCTLCNKQFNTNKELIKHLVKSHSYRFNDIYKYFNIDLTREDQTCLICGNHFKLNIRSDNINKAIGCSRSCMASLRMTINNPFSSEEVKEKIKRTNLERYGVENPNQCKDVRNKIEQTNLLKYGNVAAIASNIIKDKAKQTNLERYGTESVLASNEVRDKIKQSNLEKYGVECNLAIKEVRDKIKQTNLEKYGAENVFGSTAIKDKIKQTNLKRYSVETILSSQAVRETIKQTNLERYGVEYFCQHEKCINANHNRVSKINKDFYDKLINNDIDAELEYTVDSVGFDLKINDILIEINPTYTHNSTIGPFLRGGQKQPMSNDYHLNKTKIANNNSFHCIHIFDWDDQDKIVKLLKPRQRVYARKTSIKQVDKKVAKQFLNQYHLQGSTRTCQYVYGLYYENEIVQVMTFGKPRYNKNFQFELLRLCTKPEIEIVGGASKLLKHFEDEINPTSLLSYCDLAKFSGRVYEQLGFALQSKTGPVRHWHNMKTHVHITDNLLRQRGFDQLHRTDYGKGTSNEQLMLEYGYVEVYDCGQAVYTK